MGREREKERKKEREREKKRVIAKCGGKRTNEAASYEIIADFAI